MTTAYITLFYICLLSALTQKRTKQRRQMGPRININNSEFITIAETNPGLIIRGPKAWPYGHMHLMRSGDYYYYTFSKTLLPVPAGCTTLDSKQILL